MTNPYKVLDRFPVAPDLHIEAIFTNQSPSWYVQWQGVGVGPGRQRRKSLRTGNKQEAQIRARRFAAEFEAGRVPAGQANQATLEKLIALRMEELRQAGAMPNSLKLMQWYFDMLCVFAPQGGRSSASVLAPPFLTAFAEKLRQEGISVRVPAANQKKYTPKPLAPKSVREVLKAVRRLGRLAEYFLGRDPCRGFKLPRGPSPEVEIFTEAERAKIFADPRPEFSAIWKFLFVTGLRVGEFIWLTKNDVSFDADGQPSAVHIRHKVVNGVAWWPKHKSERLVALGSEGSVIVARALLASPGPWLFFAPDTRGATAGQWSSSRLRRNLQQRLDECGIEHGRPHTFRHTCATFLGSVASDPLATPLLKKFLGHRSLLTTEAYLHASADDVAAAIKNVNFNLSPPADQPGNVAQPQQGPKNNGQERRAG